MQTSRPDGFTEFVQSRSPALLRVAWLLTGDAAKAEDLLQTALAKTWRRWQRITAGGDPEYYVRRVLYTTYVTWWRRRWRFELPQAVVPDRADVTDLASEQANRDAVRRALAGLSRQQRAIVVLRYVDERTVADTAQVLACSPETVKVQAARALAKLRANPHLAAPSDAAVHNVESKTGLERTAP